MSSGLILLLWYSGISICQVFDHQVWFCIFLNFSLDFPYIYICMYVHIYIYIYICLYVCSVQYRHSVMSDSLQPHELQHTRPPCPSPTPGVYPNSCPLSWWCHLTISSFVVPFSSCLQSFPASGSFQMCQFSASVAKVLEFQLEHQSIQWTPRTDLLQDGLVGYPFSPRDAQVSSPTHSSKASILWHSAIFTVQLSHPYMTMGKTLALVRWTLAIVVKIETNRGGIISTRYEAEVE